MGLFDEIKSFENQNWMNDVIDEIKKNSKEVPIILYGASGYGLIIYEVLKKNKINVAYFTDDDPKKINKNINGIESLTLEKIRDINGTNSNIFLCSASNQQIIKKMRDKCINLGFNNVFYYNKFMIFYENLDSLKDKKNELEQVYEYLDDEKSRIIFKNLIKMRISGDLSYLKDTLDFNQYFDKGIISLAENEVFIDAGAYDGDTIKQFIKEADNKFTAIYGFEIDTENFKKFKFNMQNNINVYPVEAGLFNENKKINIFGYGGKNSIINEEGTDLAEVYKLDEYMRGKHVPTFIKMDIEGSEIEALLGAENIIIKNKPKLAIAIYHKQDDFFKIPLYIKKLNPQYKLYLRTYDVLPIDYICYAVL